MDRVLSCDEWNLAITTYARTYAFVPSMTVGHDERGYGLLSYETVGGDYVTIRLLDITEPESPWIVSDGGCGCWIPPVEEIQYES